MFTDNYKLLLLVIFMLFNCNDSKDKDEVVKNKFEVSKNKFEIVRLEYDNCKTDYEKKNNHKIVIDIKNGSGIKGVAKEFSDYLQEKCYDTYYGNWDNWNESKTYLILYKLDDNMATELVDLLDNNINLEIAHDLKKLEDITLVIGKDYKNLDFYKTIRK